MKQKRILTKETKLKISQSLIGRKKSLETRAKMSAYAKNRKSEHQEKLRQSQIGRKTPWLTRMNIKRAMEGKYLGKNNPFYGKKHTKETIEKIVNNRALPKGKDHWNWQGGINPENDTIRKSLKYKRWARKVREDWNYECQICGKIGGRLRANHIKKFADYPELRFKRKNGIVICEDCDISLVFWHEQEWESYFNFCWENKLFKNL